MLRVAFTLAVILLVVAVAQVMTRWNAAAPFGGLFSKGVFEREAGYYYRIRADYTVKETGEPIAFDYVVACGGTTTHWRYTGPSTRVSTHPLVLIKPTSNGGAVLIRSYRYFCEYGVEKKLDRVTGKPIEWSGAPDDLMPFVIWFDDVNDLSFGWGYATEDAYHNATSKLAFHGASATRATHEDWKAWRKQAAADYVQIGALPGPWGYSYTNSPKEVTAEVKARNGGKWITNDCRGYVRVPASQAFIDRVFAEAAELGILPSPDARYIPVPNTHRGWIWSLLDEAGRDFGGLKIRSYLAEQEIDTLGAINRNNSGIARSAKADDKVMSDHYPMLPRSRSTSPPITEPAAAYPRRILVDDAYKGMLACGGDSGIPGPDELYHRLPRPKDAAYTQPGVPGGLDPNSFDLDWESKKFPLFINEEMILDTMVDTLTSDIDHNWGFIIDREGFVFVDRPWGAGGP